MHKEVHRKMQVQSMQSASTYEAIASLIQRKNLKLCILVQVQLQVCNAKFKF